LLHVLRGRLAARLRLNAVLVGVFHAGDDFIQRWLNPTRHQFPAPVVDRERPKSLEQKGIALVADVLMPGRIGGDHRLPTSHIFHEHQIGSSLAAVGEQAHIGIAIDARHHRDPHTVFDAVHTFGFATNLYKKEQI